MNINTAFHVFAFSTAILVFNLPFTIVAQQNSELPKAEVDDAILLIGVHQGIDEHDAQTAALLVALELRKLGVSISDPAYEAPASAIVYRTNFRRLGEKILVHLTQEIPVGTVVIERQLLIANIEEMIAAAPRLADALVHDKPMDSTVDIETVTEAEARELRKVPTESHWGVGFFGAFVPGTDVLGTPGYRIGWSYELPTYAVEVEGRILIDEEAGFHFAAFSTGGLYFFNKQNISPYLGGGFSASNASDDFSFERGMGVYAVGGIQMLRTTRNRLKLELRVDRPLYSFENLDPMPITLGLFFSRHYVPGGSGCCLFSF